MATPVTPAQPSSSATPDVQEHTVRLPRERRKKYTIMKIGSGVDLDFSKLHQSQTSVRIERENNFKEYKSAYDIDSLPKFGAGSEFGREQKEQARRKKYGINIKKYNPDDQPWILKVGTGKNLKKYKGLREGTIADNTSYYIFMKCADGAFEAVPVEEWYNYTPQIRYKYLNSEEAEEEFSRRDKTLNIFNIMVKKRLRNDAGEGEEESSEKVPKSKSKKKELQLTDMDDWAEMSEEDEDEDNEDQEDDEPKKKSKAGKGKQAKKKRVKNSKHNSDDEAIEESDEGDYDDREVDYITDSGSSSDGGPGAEEEKEKTDKYEEKGVDEEDGLRKLIDSGEEDEEEEENKEEDDDDKDKDGKKKAGSDSDSSSSSSASDSDIEKDDKISSALFMQKGSEKKKAERTSSPKPDDKGVKRKMDGDGPSVKKARTDSPLTTQGGGSSSDGITEDAIRRYLMRKPMTTKDLFQKFRSKKLSMTNEAMTHVIAQLLKKINPDRKTINKVMYLSLKSE